MLTVTGVGMGLRDLRGRSVPREMTWEAFHCVMYSPESTKPYSPVVASSLTPEPGCSAELLAVDLPRELKST
jgi:hypothetical protein